MEPSFPMSPALAGRFFTVAPPGKPSPQTSLTSCPFLGYFYLDVSSIKNRGRPLFDPWVGRSSGEGNGNPLQYSCLENSMERGAWWATVCGVAKSRTPLSDWLNYHHRLLLVSCSHQADHEYWLESWKEYMNKIGFWKAMCFSGKLSLSVKRLNGVSLALPTADLRCPALTPQGHGV